jgi:plastocyanin
MSLQVVRKLTIAGSISVALALCCAGSMGFAAGIRTVSMKDQCDPASFNAAFGAGTCTGHNGGVSLNTFLQQLTQAQKAGAWHFAPGQVHLRDGDAFQVRNTGGETHTFTEVNQFGGGFVDFLNQLSGTPVPAPECLQLAPADFVPAGGVTAPEAETPGVHHYQCCIHPWMRADVVVR